MAVLVYKNKKYHLPELHPVHDDIPSHVDTDTFAEMLESMEVYGFNKRKPILRQKSSGLVVIGRRRLLCCKILDIEPVYQDVDWSEQEVLEQVRQDELHRRHLSEGERALVAVRLNAREVAINGGKGATRDEMASKAGVSVKSVQAAKAVHPVLQPVVGKGPNRISVNMAAKLSKAHAEGGLPEAELKRIAGSDDVPGEAAKAVGGKKHGGKREKKAEPEPEPESGTPLDGSAKPPAPSTPTAAPAPSKDKLGQELPDNVADAFGDNTLGELLAELEQSRKAVESLANRVQMRWTQYEEHFPFAHWEKSHEAVTEAAGSLLIACSQLTAGVPHCLCPKCGGPGCKWCRQTGYWTAHMHANRGQHEV